MLLTTPKILTWGSERLYKKSLGGFFQFKLNCGPLNLFSKRLHLISYANAPSEFLTRAGEQPPLVEPSQQVSGVFPPADLVNCYGFFSKVKALRVWKEQALFSFQKESSSGVSAQRHRQEGRKEDQQAEEENEPRGACHPGYLRGTWTSIRCHTCAPTQKQLNTHKQTYMCTHKQVHANKYTHVNKHTHKCTHLHARAQTFMHLLMCKHTYIHACTPAPSLLTCDIR